MEKSEIKKILKRTRKRLNNEIQKGGSVCGTSDKMSGVRSNNFSSSGKFGNMAKQLVFFIENSIAGITDGICALESVITLPSDLGHELGKPNEPLPDNTPIYRDMI